MAEGGSFFILLGGLFLVALIISPLARLFKIPRVTLLLLSGVALGPYGVDLLSEIRGQWFPFITDITLLIIGYLLGARLTRDYLEKYARGVMVASLIITLVTSIVVTAVLILFGVDSKVAIVLGAIAAATDPAAMIDVLRQRERETAFGKLLEGIVAMDDVLGLLVFSVALALVGLVTRTNGLTEPLLHMLYEIVGAVVLGGIAGYIAAKLLNGKRPEQPVIVESLAFILLLGGIALHLGVSFLLAAMIMGTVVVNLADKAAEHLHEIEYIEQPFLVLFFIMAGAALSFDGGDAILMVLLIFVGARIAGRFVGGWLVPEKWTSTQQKRVLGITLLPQAGVAMGMALVASHTYPDIAHVVMPVTISATVIFEVLGPVVTSRSLDYLDHS